MGHLLQIRREVRPVVRVVELQVDDVLDLCAVAVELAALLSLGGRGGAGSGARDTAGCPGGERKGNRERARDFQAFTHSLLLLDDRENLRLWDRKWASYGSQCGNETEDGVG